MLRTRSLLGVVSCAIFAAACATSPDDLTGPTGRGTGSYPTSGGTSGPSATVDDAPGELAPVDETHDVVVHYDPQEGGTASESETRMALIGGAATVVYVNGDGRTVTSSTQE